jgi:hypothetical protein
MRPFFANIFHILEVGENLVQNVKKPKWKSCIISFLVHQKWLQLGIDCGKLRLKLYRRGITMPFFTGSYASDHSYASKILWGTVRSAAASEKMCAFHAQ